MKINTVKKFVALLALALSFSFISCATSVKVDVVRPAELDLNGANSIAILPFRPARYHGHYEPRRGYRLSVLDFFFGFHDIDPDEQQSIHYLKSEIESGLMNSQYLKLISSDVVESAIRNSKPVSADVYLTGEVINFDVRDKKDELRRKVKSDKEKEDDDNDRRTGSTSKDKDEYETYYEFKRYVDVTFRYQIVDSSTDEIISFKTISISETSSSYSNPRDLPTPFSMIKWKLGSSARQILREIQPYVVTKRIELLEYSSKHPGMKYADELAKDGYVEESYEKFFEIYEDQGIFEAGYNAAMLLEALGELDDAETLMKEVSKKADSKNSRKALKALYDIRDEIKQAKKLDKQNQDRDGGAALSI